MSWLRKFGNLPAVLRIRIRFNPDPDPEHFLSFFVSIFSSFNLFDRKYFCTDSSDQDITNPDDPEAPIILRRKRYVRLKDRLGVRKVRTVLTAKGKEFIRRGRYRQRCQEGTVLSAKGKESIRRGRYRQRHQEGTVLTAKGKEFIRRGRYRQSFGSGYVLSGSGSRFFFSIRIPDPVPDPSNKPQIFQRHITILNFFFYFQVNLGPSSNLLIFF
jgi:hypothetical protein